MCINIITVSNKTCIGKSLPFHLETRNIYLPIVTKYIIYLSSNIYLLHDLLINLILYTSIQNS